MSLEQINGEGFRFYRYDPGDGSEPVDLLSVTSIRSLCGEPYNLVNWKLANLADAALGTQKRTVIGPRGGVREIRQVFEYPCEFARMYEETEGRQDGIDRLRAWLRERGEEPRNIAAMRGSIVHEAIEKNVAWDRIEMPYVEAAFAGLSSRDRARVKRDLSDEDVYFIRNSVRQYWAFRKAVPMVILSRETRVINLTVGYAGTFDALAWVLGNIDTDGSFVPLPQPRIEKAQSLRTETVTRTDIAEIGGSICLIDWKTATDIYTDNVVQATAYLAAEQAIIDGKRDDRVTQMLGPSLFGGIVHIRPNEYGLYLFEIESETIRAFLGSVAFARFLARYPKPDPIFKSIIKGKSEEVDDAAEI